MRFRSSYSCGAAEDFPSITTSPAILDCRSFDFAQDKFWIQSKIQNQKSKTGVEGGAGQVTSFPYIRLRLMIGLTPSFSSIEHGYRQDENRREYESSFPQLSHHSGLG